MADVRPIDANALNLNDIPCYYGCNCDLEDVEEWVFNVPTLDYEPVRHGEWVERKEIFDGEQEQVDAIGCSLCGKSQRVFRRTPYCPNCGAKMDGGKRNENA